MHLDSGFFEKDYEAFKLYCTACGTVFKTNTNRKYHETSGKNKHIEKCKNAPWEKFTSKIAQTLALKKYKALCEIKVQLLCCEIYHCNIKIFVRNNYFT